MAVGLAGQAALRTSQLTTEHDTEVLIELKEEGKGQMKTEFNCMLWSEVE